MRALAAVTLLLTLAAGSSRMSSQRPSSPGGEPPPLLPPGTALTALPDGDGRAIAQSRCLACHSADMLRQQRMTEAQWTASIDKMIRWGTEVPDGQKAPLVKYLTTHFGRANDSFTPLEITPIESGAAR